MVIRERLIESLEMLLTRNVINVPCGHFKQCHWHLLTSIGLVVSLSHSITLGAELAQYLQIFLMCTCFGKSNQLEWKSIIQNLGMRKNSKGLIAC